MNTRRAYSDGDRGHDDAGSEVDLTLSNASLRPLAGLPELCASAQTHVWRSKPRGQRYVEVFKTAGIGTEKASNQTIDIGLYHCPITLATKIAISAGMDFARGR
jgi:hypothetical protein